jgi:hypothetical protein
MILIAFAKLRTSNAQTYRCCPRKSFMWCSSTTAMMDEIGMELERVKIEPSEQSTMHVAGHVAVAPHTRRVLLPHEFDGTVGLSAEAFVALSSTSQERMEQELLDPADPLTSISPTTLTTTSATPISPRVPTTTSASTPSPSSRSPPRSAFELNNPTTIRTPQSVVAEQLQRLGVSLAEESHPMLEIDAKAEAAHLHINSVNVFKLFFAPPNHSSDHLLFPKLDSGHQRFWQA